MIAKGKDAADLFPAVVKNVVSKNMEIKKLVYVYLMRYAEEQQDLALLSIATFQRGLKVRLYLKEIHLFILFIRIQIN
jgi:AP-3 complex subunit beta